MTKESVAVIAGGPSPEAEVSRTSARAVRGALSKRGYVADVLELGPSLGRDLSNTSYDVAFPVVHGPLGEDGCLQGLLEILSLPYVGSGVLASALAMDKPSAKVIFRAAALPLAEDAVITRDDDPARSARAVLERFSGAVIVKPAAAGSAIGVTRLTDRDPEALAEALIGALAVCPRVLVEEMKTGSEVTCAVLEDEGGVRALEPTLILPLAASWYDFTSRYKAGGSEHRCPAPFPEHLLSVIKDVARGAHEAIGARDLSRADFVVDEAAGEVTLLEVNTLPGMTATSLFPEAAAVAGVEFDALCERLVRRALARPRAQYAAALPMP